jgi:ribose/xylose/arabinose/galactoside ABC-type transport system permease subunit
MWAFTARVNEKTAPIERIAAVQFAAAYRRVVRHSKFGRSMSALGH